MTNIKELFTLEIIYTKMPQGFKNSSGILQRIIDDILNDILESKYMVYMDDIIVYGKTKEEHDENLNDVLQRLSKNNFKVNSDKMQYKNETVKLLVYMIN
ncbi:Retrovirus-related Pol polyprotein from transposon opus [Nosema granulosis]|uniref:Retrovirus-related Pol polyprotein from transposon opus n=1 Tax=Nosema granulosis TaxID=83296 RepID=A0A9P6GUY6_9MICR|nr:Retrovirus-related Pol polyprotein from transposon opus [Nosema granulosis]